MNNTKWLSGTVIPIRHVWRGTVHSAIPAIVVDDRPERLALFTPMGTHTQMSKIDFEKGEVERPRLHVWHTTNVLNLFEPDAGHCITAMYWAATGAFACWYVDLLDPIRRAGGGIVTWDRSLDIVVAPDLTWRWKDEEEFARLLELGWITEDESERIRREGQRVIARVERRERPFNENWASWRPDPAWAVPALPDDWATVPGDV